MSVRIWHDRFVLVVVFVSFYSDEALYFCLVSGMERISLSESRAHSLFDDGESDEEDEEQGLSSSPVQEDNQFNFFGIIKRKPVSNEIIKHFEASIEGNYFFS